MRYTVEVDGETIQVDVREDAGGLEVSVGDGYLPAELQPAPAPLYTLQVGTRRHRMTVEIDPVEPGSYTVRIAGKPPLRVRPADARTLAAARGRAAAKASGPRVLRSAMPGLIVEVHVGPGDEVVEGQVVLILEAMKMQNEIRVEVGGRVKSVHVQADDTVPAGAKLLEVVEKDKD